MVMIKLNNKIYSQLTFIMIMVTEGHNIPDIHVLTVLPFYGM